MPDFGDIDPDTGRTSPRTQYGELDVNAPSVANGQITPAQWAEYQAKRKRDYILGMLGTLGGTVGLGFAGQALTGAGGAAASATGGAALPAAATEGMLPMSVAGGAGAGAAAGGAGAGSMFAGLSPRDWIGLGVGGAGAIGGALSNPATTTPNSMTQDPQMKEILDMMMGRLRKSEPLYDSALSMANGLLPVQYQKGGGGMR